MSNFNSKADEYNYTAEELLDGNNCKDAVKYYLNSLLLKRVNPQAFKGLGKAYRNLKKFDRAISALEKAKEIDSEDAEIYSELGICYLAKGNFCCAVHNFITSIKLNPNNTDTQIQLAVTHEIMGEEDMAIKIYQKIMETNPDCEKAYIQKASLLMELEMYNDALDTFLDILDLKPDYSRAYLGIGICLDKLGEISKAKRYYKKYLVSMPESANSREVFKRLKDLSSQLSSKENILKFV